MKISLHLPTGLVHEFAGYTDPVAVFEIIVELARASDESGGYTCRPSPRGRTEPLPTWWTGRSGPARRGATSNG